MQFTIVRRPDERYRTPEDSSREWNVDCKWARHIPTNAGLLVLIIKRSLLILLRRLLSRANGGDGGRACLYRTSDLVILLIATAVKARALSLDYLQVPRPSRVGSLASPIAERLEWEVRLNAT